MIELFRSMPLEKLFLFLRGCWGGGAGVRNNGAVV